jgi:hypothetical protein
VASGNLCRGRSSRWNPVWEFGLGTDAM